MNEIIKIEKRSGKETVDARELHIFLENKRQFADWIKQRIEQYDFQKEIDYTTISQNCENGGKRNEYYLSLEMSKELAMVENNEKGKIARRYFIECEKKAKQVYQIPQTYSEALLLAGKLAKENEEKTKLIEEQKPKADFFDQVAQSKTAIEMRKVAAVLDMGIGRNKLFEFLRSEKILDDENIPYRKYQDQGYFRVIEQKFTDGNGELRINFKTVVYQKGINFIKRKLEKLEE